jgi:Ca-activated chloride channel family protein
MIDGLNHFHFLRPYWLLAMLLAGVIWLALRRSGDPSRRFGRLIAPHLLKHLVHGREPRSVLRPSHALLVLWVLVIVAVAGPSWRQAPAPFAEETAGLMILLELNPGMDAEDLRPSRLERSRHKIHDLLEGRTGGTVGLIAYSGTAHLVMPLTRDTRIVEQMTQALDPSVMPAQGDALSEALTLAADQFDRRNTAGSVLIVTDGIDSAQLQALGQYREAGGPGVQILAALGSQEQAALAGIEAGARALGAPFYRMTPDDQDVRRIIRRAESQMAASGAANEAAQWQDGGYVLVPVILLGTLLWARRGWSVRWES